VISPANELRRETMEGYTPMIVKLYGMGKWVICLMHSWVKWLADKCHKHDLYVIQEFSPHARRVGCTRCNKTWAMNDNCRAFLEWDSEFEELYRDTFGHHIIKPW
jgi:hypothetical protein